LTYLFTFLAAATVLADLLLILFWKFNFRSYFQSSAQQPRQEVHPELCPMSRPRLEQYPAVAVLLAVRNEEKLLPACLNSLLSTDYPMEKLTIWIGNDASEDHTADIAKKFAQQYHNIQLIEVKQRLGDAKAKANVLAHLVKAVEASDSSPELLLVTDADVQVQPYWIGGMVQHWQARPKVREVGIVTGITLVDSHTTWGQLQRIDWLFALGMVKVASDWGMPIATMGNNQLLYHPAYRKTGGYENLPFSITEDFQMLQEIAQKGFEHRNVVAPQVVAFTQPMTSWSELLQQRRRWMHGAIRLPWSIVSILFIQALFYPALILLFTYSFTTALGLWLLKVAVQSFFIAAVEKKLALQLKYRQQLYRYLLLYDLYAAVLTILTILIYYLPVQTRWKGRKY
jgi:cellulose synthase/poly-beta-1,6-N-acetylglucosamine synthase-like glycosyltransferase